MEVVEETKMAPPDGEPRCPEENLEDMIEENPENPETATSKKKKKKKKKKKGML